MPAGVQHRVVCVAIEQGLQSTLTSLLRARGAEPATTCPDLPTAYSDALAHPTEPHLFVVQIAASDDPSRLTLLTASLPGQPVLVLLPAGSDIGRLLAVQRAGASQIVTVPLVATDFLQALDCLLLQFAPPPREARVLGVCGVSGGCGATTVALNLACELAQSGKASGRRSVLLVELARGMGTLATYLDIEPEVTTHEIVRDASHLSMTGIRRAMVNVAPGLDVLVGPYQDIFPSLVPPRNVYQLVELCRKLATHVVLDVPCTLDALQFETLGLADQVVLVGVQSVPSIRTLKMVRDTLDREQGIGDQVLVLNRYEPAMPGFSAERLAKLLDVPAVLTVANDYPSVMAALNHGKPLQMAVPHSPVVSDIRKLAARLIGATGTPSAGDSSDRLMRALGRPVGPRAVRALRVLHIEDDAVQREAVALRLGAMKEFSVTITHATSETAAVALFHRQGFDLVLLDYHLAQGNGLSCLRQLRQIDDIVPILVVSGVDQPQIAAELLAAGADDFLSKENLGGEQLSRSMTAAVTRADACKQRLGVANKADPPDTVFDRLRATFAPDELTELFNSLVELHQITRPGRFSAAQIQRLVDLVSAELEQSPGEGPPRRALLSLFLRLFSPRQTGG